MKNTHGRKLGLVLGAIAGGVHIIWSLLVLVGWAQPLVDFILWAHMVRVPFVVEPFNIVTSLTLIVVTATIGFIVGCAAGTIWEKVNK